MRVRQLDNELCTVCISFQPPHPKRIRLHTFDGISEGDDNGSEQLTLGALTDKDRIAELEKELAEVINRNKTLEASVKMAHSKFRYERPIGKKPMLDSVEESPAGDDIMKLKQELKATQESNDELKIIISQQNLMIREQGTADNRKDESLSSNAFTTDQKSEKEIAKLSAPESQPKALQNHSSVDAVRSSPPVSELQKDLASELEAAEKDAQLRDMKDKLESALQINTELEEKLAKASEHAAPDDNESSSFKKDGLDSCTEQLTKQSEQSAVLENEIGQVEEKLSDAALASRDSMLADMERILQEKQEDSARARALENLVQKLKKEAGDRTTVQVKNGVFLPFLTLLYPITMITIKYLLIIIFDVFYQVVEM